MKISITDRHIKDGERKSLCGCPVALAISDVLGGNFEVTCNRAYRFGEDVSAYLPDEIRDWIRAFDAGATHLLPIEFDLPVFT